MAEAIVYWIHRQSHTDMRLEGYVGVTTVSRFERRMWEHSALNGNRHLTHAINKHGWDALQKRILLIGTMEYCLSMEMKLRPEDKIGWNLVKGGGMPPSSKGKRFKKDKPAWNKGRSWSSDIKEKVREGVRKLWQDPEYRRTMSAAHKGRVSPMRGRKHSEETKAKIVAAKIGRPSPKKGRPASAEQIDAMRAKAREQAWICPHCGKEGFAKGAGNRWHFDNCKSKVFA